ncbi:MAG: arginine--tRNA ligase [Candidatus Yonathbacteria bacterium]|nr:arginine--tRNA ligase [Candidatus Yonathbacteria bacterium]
MIRTELENLIRQALNELSVQAESVSLETPLEAAYGDYATGVSLAAAKQAGKNPKELAEAIKGNIEQRKDPLLERVEVAGPGFINFHLSTEGIERHLKEVATEIKGGYKFRKGEKINIEFISANPTGDLHIGHGRGAFFGDALARVFSYAGAQVTREYYMNDSRESAQIKELGKTALGKGEQYRTEKLVQLLKSIDVSGKSEEEAGVSLAALVQESNRRFIESKLNIPFDVWYSEDEKLRATGANDAMLAELSDKGLTYEREGAVWLKTSEYGDDEDRVVVRSDLNKSYFISDITYHQDKFARGFDTVIDVWGADHHGHVKRMYAAGKMLGWPQKPVVQPIIFITQLVSLKEGGEVKKMSKRAGTAIYLEDLVDEFGIDVVRWFFAEKTLNTHMEFDAALAREQSQKNPVFYVQYAHARIHSVLENVRDLAPSETTLLDAIAGTMGRALALKLLQFPEVVLEVTKEFQVNKLTTYAYELASEFSQFYRDERVIEGDQYNTGALLLMKMTKEVLAKSISLLGISAPERM